MTRMRKFIHENTDIGGLGDLVNYFSLLCFLCLHIKATFSFLIFHSRLLPVLIRAFSFNRTHSGFMRLI